MDNRRMNRKGEKINLFLDFFHFLGIIQFHLDNFNRNGDYIRENGL